MPAADLVPRRYVPKESVPPLGLVVTLLVMLLAVSALASIYAVAIFYVPFVNVLTLLAAPALGAGAAMFSQRALEAGRIRSPLVGLAITVLAAVLALHVSWVVWITVLGKDSALLQLAYRPLELARAIALVNTLGSCKCGELNVLAIDRHTIQEGHYDCVVIAKDLLVDASLVRALGRSS